MNNSVEVEEKISNEVVRTFSRVLLGLVCQLLVAFGCGSNVINMAVFYKLGFKDTINISLFTLAISDFCSLFVCIWMNILVLPWFQALEFPIDPSQIQILVTIKPNLVFTRITALVTSLIMAERCLCVMTPLKVKTIVTRKRVTFFIVISWVVVIGSEVPTYLTTRYDWRFSPRFNKTVVGIVYTEDRDIINSITSPIANALYLFSPFVFIVICTALLVASLRRKAEWREKTMTVAATRNKGKESAPSQRKETRIAQMVVFISALFIASYFPRIVYNLVQVFSQTIRLTGKYEIYTLLMTAIQLVLQAVNASMNIFLYYKYSTNYRQMFHKLIICCKNKEVK